ncbi:hypothetical protein, partial [Novispirillum itersonii]|uniref:hypothetical protein n=1 Tax=Novispirillum itersonii TaxID=189 RepID=UPI0012DE2684
MLRFLKTVAIALALASLLPVATAFAATESPPADQWQADPPDHWRTMHPWPSRVPGTSRCLQQKTTPVCAVETQLYCAFAWSNPACDKLSKGDLAVALLTIIPQDMSSDYHYLKYRLPLVEIVTVGQADAIHATASQPGDYRVDMQVTYCHIKTKVCREDILPIFNFLLREVGGDWQVVEWDSLPLLKTGEMVPGTTLPKEQWMADPPDLWRKLTNSDDKPSTSRCIGQTTSPVCAVETLLACYRREVEDFCRKAVLDTGWTKFNERPERSIGYAGYTKYRLSLVEKVSVGQADAVDGAASQPGDYRIDVQATHCLDPENFCETDIGP